MSKSDMTPSWRSSRITFTVLTTGLIVTLLYLVQLFDLSPAVTWIVGPPLLPPLRLQQAEPGQPKWAPQPRPSLTINAALPSASWDQLDNVPGFNSFGHYDDGFSIVTPTYRRPHMLSRFLDTYATGEIPSLRLIVIQWVDPTTEPPQWLLDRLINTTTPCTLRRMNNTSLNERFRPDAEIGTAAVLSLDDDVIIRPSDIEQGYQTWRQFGHGRRRMVGYFARTITKDRRYTARQSSTYNMVLTKAAFFHVDWLSAYWHTSLKTLRSVVDDSRNCEDILMAHLMAYYTREAPVYFRASYSDWGTWHGGISQGRAHAAMRDRCAEVFADGMGHVTLVSTSLEVKARR